MSHALSTGSDAEILRNRSKLAFEQGAWSWTIERIGDQSWYHVTNGIDHVRAIVAWAFGLGAAGQTYVVQWNGSWYESRVSYYRRPDRLDVTIGFSRALPRTMAEAVGRQLSSRGALECFNCHGSRAVVSGLPSTVTVVPGVQCVRCHQNADGHAAGFTSADAPKVFPPDLSKLSTEEMSDFCGQCHRTWSAIAANGPHDVANVRFQPYRLTNSKCYDAADPRIRCVSCHDPHAEVVSRPAFYDSRCLACHSGAQARAVCPVAKSDCVTCHMPKTPLPGAHDEFTDHRIRVVRNGDPYPD